MYENRNHLDTYQPNALYRGQGTAWLAKLSDETEAALLDVLVTRAERLNRQKASGRVCHERVPADFVLAITSSSAWRAATAGQGRCHGVTAGIPPVSRSSALASTRGLTLEGSA